MLPVLQKLSKSTINTPSNPFSIHTLIAISKNLHSLPNTRKFSSNSSKKERIIWMWSSPTAKMKKVSKLVIKVHNSVSVSNWPKPKITIWLLARFQPPFSGKLAMSKSKHLPLPKYSSIELIDILWRCWATSWIHYCPVSMFLSTICNSSKTSWNQNMSQNCFFSPEKMNLFQTSLEKSQWPMP